MSKGFCINYEDYIYVFGNNVERNNLRPKKFGLSENDRINIEPLPHTSNHMNCVKFGKSIIMTGFDFPALMKYKINENEYEEIYEFPKNKHKILFKFYDILYIICDNNLLSFNGFLMSYLSNNMDFNNYAISERVFYKGSFYMVCNDKYLYEFNYKDREITKKLAIHEYV